MKNVNLHLDHLLLEKLHLDPGWAEVVKMALVIFGVVLICIALNWTCQNIYRWTSTHWKWLMQRKWHIYLSKRKLGPRILLLIPGIAAYFLPYVVYPDGGTIVSLMHRGVAIYIVVIIMMICDSMLRVFLDAYSRTDKSRIHPLRGLIQGLQVALYFIGGIIIVAIIMNKSLTALLAGLGASAAVLMLIFKDSILGLVAGVQLAQNNMVQIGDWIQMPDESANGCVEEITLNTVKIRNWDNTLSMIPPYTLMSTPFKNWRGMQESGGRRVDKCIFIDITSLKTCGTRLTNKILKTFPILQSAYTLEDGITNLQLYRSYIELYLKQHPEVNTELDMIITQKEGTPYGTPVEVYFFLKDKNWASFEKKQSDIFDHLSNVVPIFGLRLYQRG